MPIPRRLAALFTSLLLVASVANPQQRRRPHPQQEVTAPCAAIIVSLADANGTSQYVALRYQLSAIDSAQDGLADFDEHEAANKDSTDLTQVLADDILNASNLRDNFECSAQILSRWRPVNAEEETTRKVLMVSYRRIATDIDEHMRLIKSRFVRSDGQRTKNAILRDSEKSAAIDSATSKAQLGILQATGYALLQSIDLSGPEKDSTPFMLFTCVEHADLLSRSEAAAREEKSDYGKAAGMIHKALLERSCRPGR